MDESQKRLAEDLERKYNVRVPDYYKGQRALEYLSGFLMGKKDLPPEIVNLQERFKGIGAPHDGLREFAAYLHGRHDCEKWKAQPAFQRRSKGGDYSSDEVEGESLDGLVPREWLDAR